MEVDDFDLEFADELDVLNDIEESQDYGVKGKRSLKFETPKGDKSVAVVPPAQDSPSSPLDEVPWDSPEDHHGNNIKQSWAGNKDKRPLEEEDAFLQGRAATAGKRRRRLVEEAEFDEDDLPDINFTVSQRFTRRESSGSEPEAVETTVIRPVETKVYRYKPQVHSISVTSTEGDRFYLKLKDEQQMEQQISNMGKHFRGQSLLDVPYYELRQQAEDEMARRLLQEAHLLSEERRRSAELLSGPDAEIEQRYLWVERYSPHHYTDLLSDEGINRSLLHWLKLWDYVVFSKDVPKVKGKGKIKKWDKFQKKNQEVLDELDKLRRPQQKVVLMCGPPGSGQDYTGTCEWHGMLATMWWR